MPVMRSTLRMLLPSQSIATAVVFFSSFNLFIFSPCSLEKDIILFKMMQEEKEQKKRGWGGRRENAGRKPGRTKTTLSVSVNETIFARAIKRWRKKTSPLVENLLDLYGSKHISLEEAAHE